jgi:hypothetical protein
MAQVLLVLRLKAEATTGSDNMAKCDVCGNDYDKSFEVRMAGATYTFDSFECAIHKLAPECDHCGCKIIGHGMETEGRMFCCAMCAEHEGVPEMVDRVPQEEGRV